MRRGIPIVTLAVMTAMVVTAAALKWRTRPSSAGASPAVPREGVARAAGSTAGLGAGPPPGDAGAAAGAAMLHGDARRTHRAAGRVPTATPAVLWTRDVGGPVEAQVTASPDEKTLYAASLGGALTAIDRADGSVRWTLALGERAYATPCVAADGTVYAGSDAKKFIAVTPDGRIKWSLETDGDADTGAAIAPDGTIVFAAGRMVYGASAGGSLKWRFASKRKVFTAPAIAADGRVFFGAQDHKAYALTPAGTLAWSTDLGDDVDGAPAIGDDGAVYVGSDAGEVVRLDPGDGHVVWRAKVGGFVRGPLSIARGGDVLAGVYGPTPREVRIRDGEVRGSFAVQGTGARDFGVRGGALEDEAGTLVFGAQDDAVYAVDAAGQLLWRFATGGDVDAPATLLGDGTVVVGSDDGTVRALR